MKYWLAALFLLPLSLWIFAASYARRDETRTVTLSIPQMADERTIRIITNSVLDQLIGDDREPTHLCEIDLARHRVLYHEGPVLGQPAYQGRLLACLRQVGFEARLESVRFDPPALVPTCVGPRQAWADRHTASMELPGMKTVADANVVAAALSYARTGDDPQNIVVDRERRTVTVTFKSSQVAVANFERAVAFSGFDVDGQPALLGGSDAIPMGWVAPRG